MAFFLSIFPIVLLIFLMIKRKALPSYIAIPITAVLIYILQLFYFKNNFALVNANVIAGIIATFTPITVIFGAILFNHVMEKSGAIDILRQWLSQVNPNPIAKLMIIGWAFVFMIEGVAGFGTPAALAAPILVGLGFRAIPVAIFTLVMDSVPVSFGGVGIPTWFGFAPLNLSEDVILNLGFKTALIHLVAAFIIPIIALRFITSWQSIRKNIVFIYLSIFSCVIPYVIIAKFNYEFPALIGGVIGLLCSVALAKYGIGMEKGTTEKNTQSLPLRSVIKALFPLMMIVFLLLITRIHQLGLNALLTDVTTWFSVSLGKLGDFSVSRALILSLNNIFGEGVSSSYRTLYVPALIPFIVTVLLVAIVFRLKRPQLGAIFGGAFTQIQKPFIALMFALIMVKLMLIGGDDSMVQVIGKGFAEATGAKWTVFASYLGAIGAFFSGSNTVSNLTFGGIQYSIAQASGLSIPLILALQSVGGAMGNMVCLNNVIAVCAVLEVKKQEGNIIKKTVWPMLLYGIIAALVATIVF